MTILDPTDAAPASGPLPAGHQPVKPAKVGVLLVNLGTPDGTDYKSMWRYLREFLSDPRVIELPRVLWYPILYGLVLTTRPRRSGSNYARIWNREKDESPLRTFTRGQAEKQVEELGAGQADPLGQASNTVAPRIDQGLKCAGLLKWIKILALDILGQADLEVLGLARGAGRC